MIDGNDGSEAMPIVQHYDDMVSQNLFELDFILKNLNNV